MSSGRLLILGGTGEARQLAEELDGVAGLQVTSSLAGRVSRPNLPAGAVRVGGFGGAAGMCRWLREHRIDAVVDATHPFAAGITANAAVATAEAGVPLLVLLRPGWAGAATQDWWWVDSLAAAAALLPMLGRRIFLSTGRTELAPFAPLDALWFLLRSIEPPEPPLPRQLEVVLDSGPFTVAGEVELLRRYRIDVLVTKDSGGAMVAAKLEAARVLGIPVVIRSRPWLPTGVTVCEAVETAVHWVRDTVGVQV